MSIALLKRFRELILKTDCMEDCIMVMKKKMNITDLKNLSQVYYEAIGIRSTTPSSFAIFIKKLKLFDTRFIQNFNEDKISQIFSKDSIDQMPLFSDEVLNY